MIEAMMEEEAFFLNDKVIIIEMHKHSSVCLFTFISFAFWFIASQPAENGNPTLESLDIFGCH